MFFPRQSPPVLADSKLLSLRVSLNTPVLATEQLPAGPAEAAIVVLVGADGTPSVTVAARSVKAGALAFYVFEGPLEGEADLETALDGALSFGESMGFLFDDDALTQGDAASQRALDRWLELLGGSVAPPAAKRSERAPSRAPAPGSSTPPEDADEITAAGPAESSPELVLDRPVAAEPAAKAGPKAAGRPPLTKFRRALATPAGGQGAHAKAAPRPAPADADPVLLTPHGPAVGRVQLVKQRRDEAQPAPLDPLLHLLASL
jgi:hypothetical protein